MAQQKDFNTSQKTILDFDPIVLVRDVLKRWILILTAVVIAGVSAFIVTDRSYRPTYRTSATLVVNKRSSATTVYANLQSATTLASVLTNLLNSSVLQDVVLEELGSDIPAYTISASAIAETNLMTLQVSSSDPRTAFLVMQTLLDNHHTVTEQVVGDVIIEVLQLPKVPTGPSNWLDLSGAVKKAALLAALASSALIAFYAYMRDTIRSRKEAERKLKCWCLGELPHERKYKTLMDWILRRMSSMTVTNPGNSFRFVEANRKLRRKVEQRMGEGKVIMVTSVMENEGKSTVSVNLALSLAKKHYKTLLIDLDLRKPACHKILQQKGGRYGTRDIINGNAELIQAIETDHLSGLDVLLERITVKSAKPQVASMFSSDGVEQMIKVAREQYDYVVLDLSPLSAAPDAEYVMQHADGILMVVHQNKTRAAVINKAISVLQAGQAKLLGCVVNNVYSSGIMDSQGTDVLSGNYGKYGRYGKYGKYGDYSKTRKPGSESAGKSGS